MRMIGIRNAITCFVSFWPNPHRNASPSARRITEEESNYFPTKLPTEATGTQNDISLLVALVWRPIHKMLLFCSFFTFATVDYRLGLSFQGTYSILTCNKCDWVCYIIRMSTHTITYPETFFSEANDDSNSLDCNQCTSNEKICWNFVESGNFHFHFCGDLWMEIIWKVFIFRRFAFMSNWPGILVKTARYLN